MRVITFLIISLLIPAIPGLAAANAYEVADTSAIEIRCDTTTVENISDTVVDRIACDTTAVEVVDEEVIVDENINLVDNTNFVDNTTVFRPTQLILPASLITVGAVGVASEGFKKLNRSVKDGMDKLRGDHKIKVDDYLRFLPTVAYLGLDFVGVRAKHDFRERLVVGATALVTMEILVTATKYSVRERRPDTGERNSFPSGHTATAFAGAELVRMEYGNWIGAGAYAVATGVAFLRLYNGRHWLNDVIAGAGIGILSARIGYWLLPLYRKWFKWDSSSRKDALVITPGYNFAYHAVSVGLSYRF